MNTEQETTGYPPVYLIIVNRNGIEHLRYCLPSINDTDYQNYKTVVIDNASTDGSVEFMGKNFSNIDIIKYDTNLGWAAGSNAGIRYALDRDAEYIALLNTDIKVDRRWLREAVGILEKRREIGMLGFEIIRGNNPDTEALFLNKIKETKPLLIEETGNIQGCALLCRAEVFESVGLFDEIYFGYGEENDFESRARRAGYKIAKINIPLWHYGEGSFGTVPLFAGWLTIRNHIRYYIKNGSLRDVINIIKHIFNQAINPFLKQDKPDFVNRRMRPSNLFINFVLVIGAIFWNLFNLPTSLYIKREDNKRVLMAREKLTKVLNGKLNKAHI